MAETFQIVDRDSDRVIACHPTILAALADATSSGKGDCITCGDRIVLVRVPHGWEYLDERDFDQSRK